MTYSLSTDLAEIQQRINHYLSTQLETLKTTQAPLANAMAYAVLLGGKRVRPFLMYTTGRMLGVHLAKIDASAGAMESIHAYSLVHDDLPAMDDDALRRGKPTCHIAFDEATAILAGDALQSFAFELIADDELLTPLQKIRQIQSLAKAAGAKGMCLGQNLDLLAENKAVSLEELELIYRNKTAALIEAQAIGLAFQVQDDILDVIGETDKIGKTVGADEQHNKSTYPKLLGLEGAQQKAQKLYQVAIDALNELNFDTTALKELADFIIHREN